MREPTQAHRYESYGTSFAIRLVQRDVPVHVVRLDERTGNCLLVGREENTSVEIKPEWRI